MTKERGRPTKLTNEVRLRIIAKVRTGLPYPLAAQSVGISRSVADEWLRRGEDREQADRPDIEPFRSFALDVRQAQAQAAEMFHQLVFEGAVGWRPSRKTKGARAKSQLGEKNLFNARWVLERRYAEYYGQAQAALAVSVGADDATNKRPVVNIIVGTPRPDDA